MTDASVPSRASYSHLKVIEPPGTTLASLYEEYKQKGALQLMEFGESYPNITSTYLMKSTLYHKTIVLEPRMALLSQTNLKDIDN